MMKRKSTRIIIVGIVSFLILALILIIICNKVFFPAFNQDKITYVYIDDKKDYQDVLFQLKSAHIKDIDFFKQLAVVMKYPENVKSGKYEIKPAMSYIELLKMLRSGEQSPVQLTFNTIRLKKDLIERVGSQFMFGQEQLANALADPDICETLGFDTTTIVCMFIPNTYQIYWTVSVDHFLQKMKKEYERFWTAERLDKAKELSLSPVEVAVLASIVEEETAARSEYPEVAGLYINRLRKGMLLQADPTVKFAVGDFALRRILYAHLSVDSPYNTYKYQGLPPGPIRIPSIAGMNAVLNYTRHNYLYMAAKEDFSGRHRFAVTFSEHKLNARKYQEALNQRGIR
jgi:UPF0755 protein